MSPQECFSKPRKRCSWLWLLRFHVAVMTRPILHLSIRVHSRVPRVLDLRASPSRVPEPKCSEYLILQRIQIEPLAYSSHTSPCIPRTFSSQHASPSTRHFCHSCCGLALRKHSHSTINRATIDLPRSRQLQYPHNSDQSFKLFFTPRP